MKIKKHAVNFITLVLMSAACVYAADEKKAEKDKALYLHMEAAAFSGNPIKATLEKREATIFRVKEQYMEVDKGSLNNVEKRDVYEVYDSSGHFKGLTEMEGVGEQRSIGYAYSKKKNVSMEPGDTVKYRGQRKFLEFGLMFGSDFKRRQVDTFSGGGLLWKWNARGGWGIDFLWASFRKETDKKMGVLDAAGDSQETLSSKYAITCPIGVRKYFHYPTVVSPFLGGGVAWFSGKFKSDTFQNRWVPLNYGTTSTGYMVKDQIASDEAEKSGVIPYALTGVELFSGWRVHLNLEARYFYTPALKGKAHNLKDKPTIFSAMVTTTW